ncbi:MAG: acyltransferase [Clostridia bacterium]|nr:acyltransferase [Clostridia bacterium]
MTKENVSYLQKEKMTNVSLIRFISTILIFVFHVLFATTLIAHQYFPFRFAVQIFLFISGFLYAGKIIKDLKSFYSRNFVKILVPVLIMIFIYFSIFGVLSACGVVGSLRQMLENGGLFTTLGHLWFVFAILLCYLLTPMIEYCARFFVDKEQGLKKNKAVLFLVLLCAFSIINIVLGFFGAQMVLLAYIAGYFFRKIYPKILNNKKLFIFISLLCFLIFSALFYVVSNHILLSEELRFGIKEFLVFFVGVSFSVFLLLALEFLNNRPTKIERFLNHTDYYSYPFYLCHHVFLVGQGGLIMIGLTKWLWVDIFLVFLASLVFSIIVGMLSKKLVPHVNKIGKFLKSNKNN